ncbi:hypothetical protein [Halosegnis longus]|uniref:Uncharacterized protein n=1 Tax=Halosegnis longus TaxID=2216012 RepID=A0AAJ4R6W8_9EURY|nr:hypothetical protein [Halosegnis longus]RNJ25711.1 hypothetical protein Nmn1133_02735 [Salella cibi]
MTVPKGIARDTLFAIIVGWYRAGGDDQPVNTAAAAEQAGYSDATSRQTPFLEAVGILDAEGQDHQLTSRGAAFAAALASDDEPEAKSRAYTILSAWPPSSRLRDILRGGAMPEDDLLARVADVTGADLDTSRERIGCRTLLDVLVWAGVLDRTDDGLYLPGEVETRSVERERAALTVGLELSVDVDPDDVEALVRAVQSGLEDEESPSIAAELEGLSVRED